MATVTKFEDLDVWKLSRDIANNIYAVTNKGALNKDYALRDQIRRSAIGISSNIAEAFGRKTKKDKQYFYIISRGSAHETQNHLLYGNGVNYFEDKVTNYLIEEYDDLIHQLNKIMKSLG